VLAACVAASPAAAALYMTQAQALALAFPGARVERKAYALSAEQARAVQNRAKVRLESRLVTAYLGWRDSTFVGTAFFDSRTVRTLPGTFMVVVAPDSTVARVDVLAFHEPPDYLPPARWLELFGRRRLDDNLAAAHGIPNLSGATLSTRAVTETVRLALACHELLVAPELAARTTGMAGR
jgi:hypothetical protein